jgi:ERCC4-type nuclease
MSNRKLIDHREHVPKIVSSTKLRDYSFAQLTVGDIWFEGKDHIVEFKNWKDWIQNLIRGRIVNQIINMQANYSRCTVIVIGGRISYRGKMEHAFLGRIASLTARSSACILHVESYDQAIYLAEKIFAKAADQKELKPIVRVDKSIKNRRIAMLAAIPLIGKEFAPKLIEEFKTIQNVSNASVEKLMTIKGIGKGKAGQIHHLLCDEDDE